tara:strand:- start:1778 stop:2191 length:414 start_codon:yes stop_codon:yes gene_type:complete
MVFDIRKLNSTDYEETLVEWWKDWGWDPPAKDFLPNNGEGGFIVYELEIPICAGFLYVTNSQVAWVNWIVSNKKYTNKKKREQTLNLLINTLVNLASNSGKSYVFANNNNLHLINRYLKLGFSKGCENSTELVYKIK